MAWRRVSSAAEVPEGCLSEVIVGDSPYAICNVGGEIRALLGVCPHHGGPLGQGALEGSVVTCPWHAWEFDSATGACVFNAELKVPAYPARVEDGQIVVDLPEMDLPEHA